MGKIAIKIDSNFFVYKWDKTKMAEIQAFYPIVKLKRFKKTNRFVGLKWRKSAFFCDNCVLKIKFL